MLTSQQTKPKKKRRDSSASDSFWFDKDEAQRAVDFFARMLRHVKGELAGQPFILQQWQADDIVRPLFGWKRADGTRRYRRAYIEVPRKSGKSTISAGIGLYLLYADGEAGAEIYSAASDREQAAIVFDVARTMVEEKPSLKAVSEVYRRSIVVKRANSSYRVLSADAPHHHGLNAHGIIFDELHAQPNRELWDVLTTSVGARRQPLIVAITTAGYDRNSICWEVHDYALKVRDGIIDDPSFLPVIYAAPDDADWRNRKTWATANPGMGVTISEDYLAAECQRAIETPGYQNTFRRLHLNQWTEQSERWLDMATWDEGDEPFDAESLNGRECFGGLDLSSTTDLSAFVLVFPPLEDGERWKCLCWFWLPEENARKRADRDRVPYDVWGRDGLIELTEGNVIDYAWLRKRINELAGQKYQIKEIMYDRWNASQLVTWLTEDGATMVPMGQGFASMTAPTKELEKLVVGRQLQHGSNPILRWMASNVAVSQDPAGNLKPDKAKSTEKIDGIVALIMGIASAVRHQGEEPSVYEERGVIVL